MCTISLIKFFENKFLGKLIFNDFELLLKDVSEYFLLGDNTENNSSKKLFKIFGWNW